jgi:hypothetical protein
MLLPSRAWPYRSSCTSVASGSGAPTAASRSPDTEHNADIVNIIPTVTKERCNNPSGRSGRQVAQPDLDPRCTLLLTASLDEVARIPGEFAQTIPFYPIVLPELSRMS